MVVLRKYSGEIERLENRCLLAFEDWGLAERLIRLPDAIDAYRSMPLNGAGQTIAVIDSGIDYTHPALGGGFGPSFKVVGGYDFVDNDPDPMDTYGHGTEVAGIIAADEFMADGLRHRGIAPSAKLVSLRIDSNGGSVPDSRIEQALQWVIDNRTTYEITVVNISYGTGRYDEPTISTIYGDEIQTLIDSGVTIVAAAGNGGVASGRGIDTPAADPNVIAVGSVNGEDVISSFSERGNVLDILAPGEFVYTTLRSGGYGVVDGTSFASPVVAGTVALMRSIDSQLRPADIRSILVSSGVLNFDGDLEDAPYTRLTFPRLDLLSALELTRSRMDAPPAEQQLFGQYGNGNSLAVDRFGITHFVYYDSSARTMRYSTRSNAGVWSRLQTIDTSLPFQGYYLSLAVDRWGRPSVAYFDGVNGDLKYAHFNGVRWTTESIDTKNSVGLYPSLVFDRNELPVISYYRKTTGDLRVARQNDQGNWVITEVDANGDVGRDTSLSMDRNGRLGIAYADSTTGFLKYAMYNPSTDQWANTFVDKLTRGVSFISTRFDPDNKPVISYYDATPADLKIARFYARKWTTERVVSRGATGLFSNLFFDTSGDANILYFDKRAQSVMRATSSSGVWTLQTLFSSAGRFIASAEDGYTGVLRFSYYDNLNAKLRISQTPI
ncbi:MAG: hypothetical protein KatS3mg104_1675 [Phycisphaerae bacterium]|jgi:hypothetical protein|nr:MAG: hypothetical protein KatS3mg104_1675 [Phycisphaerae bacterium]